MKNKKIYSYDTFNCMKCNHNKYLRREIRATGSFLAGLLNWNTEVYTAIICKECRFTELYLEDGKLGENITEVVLGT